MNKENPLADRKAVESLFTTVGIEVINVWELMNSYWPRSAEHYHKLIVENPGWLIQTPFGMISIAPRKRVWDISWYNTEIRKIITEDDVTKDETYVHAWSWAKVIEYLMTLREEARILSIELPA